MYKSPETDQITLDRRAVLRNLALAAGLAGGSAIVGRNLLGSNAAFAQDATPGAHDFPPADLAVLEIAISPDATATVATEIAAGSVIVRATFDVTEWGNVFLIQVPDDVTEDVVLAGLESDEMPEFFPRSRVLADLNYETGDPESTLQLVANLSPGEWYAAVTSDAGSSVSKILVTGEAAFAEIAANVDVAYDHYDFSMPAEIPSGKTVWRVTNADPTVHHMMMFNYPRALSDDEILTGFMISEGMASPVAGFDESQVQYVGGIGVLSQGEVIYQELDFAPGYYFAVCFVSDYGMEEPHLMSGMIESFTVV